MKAYRIPYPIAKLLIKNIIKLTLEYKGRWFYDLYKIKYTEC
jgi:hypothetical protein